MKLGGLLSTTFFIAMLTASSVPAAETTEATTPTADNETNLEEMVVTATRTEKSVADAPGSVSIVSKKEMKKRNVQAIDEALSLLPGVFDNRIKGLMGTTSSVIFRGLSGSGRTLLLLDGMPMNDAYSSSQQWAGLFAQDMQRIEVVRGPSSNLYGGSAMGGVINLMTAMPNKREFTLTGGYGDAWNSGEAMQNLWTSHASYGDRLGKLSLYTAFGYRSTDGYPTGLVVSSSIPATPVPVTGGITTTNNKGLPRFVIGDTGDNGWWEYTASARAQYDISDSANIRFSWLRAANKYFYENPHTYLTSTTTGAPVFPNSVSSFLSGEGSTVQDTYTFNAEALFGPVKGKLLFGINDQAENWYTTPSGATLAGGPGTKSDSPNRTYFTDLQLSMPIMERHILTGGFSFKYENADSNNYPVSSYKDPDSVTGASTQWGGGVAKTYSAYLQAEIALLDSLTLYAGLRDDYWVSTEGYDGQTATATTPAFSNQYPEKTKNSFSPKGALVWKPLDGTTLRISGGKAFRPPPLNQLYKTWISGSSHTVYNSNPQLDPETVLSWDAGVEQKLWKGAMVRATYFENYLDKMIYNITIGPSPIFAGYTDKRYTNVGGAESKGVELEAEQSFGKFVRLFAGYTYNDSAVTEYPDANIVGKQLTQAPRHMLNAGIDASYGPASLFTTWRYASKRYAQDDNSDVVSGVYGSYDPFMVWDIKTSYKVSEQATVSLSVNNLLDERYFVYYVSPGRSWFVNMEYKF